MEVTAENISIAFFTTASIITVVLFNFLVTYSAQYGELKFLYNVLEADNLADELNMDFQFRDFEPLSTLLKTQRQRG